VELLVVLLLPLLFTTGYVIPNQDSVGSSGTFRAGRPPSTAAATLSTIGSWPSQNQSLINIGRDSFTVAAFDGQAYIWLVPFNSRCVVRIHYRSLEMELFYNWPKDKGDLKLGSAAFHGVSRCQRGWRDDCPAPDAAATPLSSPSSFAAAQLDGSGGTPPSVTSAVHSSGL
jgi:hypothetical protein